MKYSLVVPTYNAGLSWQEWIEAYQNQAIKAEKVIVIDSSSTDQTAALAEQADFFVYKIEKSKFDHGGTRNLTVEFTSDDTEILVFLTQDALFASSDSLEELIKPFQDPEVGAVYGRQLPHKDATLLAAHARLFNYPPKSIIKSKESISELGLKTAFISNSFAAYRCSIFEELGGFPEKTILAEDMYLAAKIILNGYKIVYNAEAKVYHSHNYSLIQEFQRYFDTGVFQKEQSWIRKEFGEANNEGKKFVCSEIKYLLKNNFLLLSKAIFHTMFKFLGFKLGLNYEKLPRWLCIKFSMHKNYWK
ncbi:glycosyltransferase [Actinobacillus pleuropneumoniae]|uniref:Glycosyltransferase family 2 protein n=1 Tax=Actinobacillus pleuropneumoniae TaxID=715 RepID=A0ABN5MNV4_ACTPL|nr:glycosyltransferase [Actinobacillus pleuropneumoniae]ASU15253.1 Poly-beta-1,6-N-acetyl-D-glucosamine synthase [Actinobacillus pleuropneumoniae]AWG95843.1 glycosyltransferase family 2 protein [Actinobacillus pleuropneumoniae serovar 1 str. 4074]AXA21913.1 glycosyltransferase family 2 protein [Actinobacillus pleuropneumoniae]EFM93665.1 O antigen biosynthesis rhamnosyltransferase rfbN [Actinobacillus pleuropneumoniae serovar 9 str. CVJ13261]EFM97990.1 O antigen biosynthesis rhamnosyltransferas